MADIIVDVSLPNPITTDVTSPTQALATNISVPGPQGPAGPKGNPTTINSLGAENIIITGADGNIVYTTGLNTIFISGNSGYFQSAVNSLTTNLNLTGANLNTSINNLSGLFTGYTGNLDNNYATDAQLESTGSNLYSLLINFSGNLDATYASDLQLYNTGSTLDNKINSLSGYSASDVNLATTGSNLYTLITNFSGNLDTDFASQAELNSLSGYVNLQDTSISNNLISTGSTLDSKINSLSGNLTSNYSTIINLATTGSTLNSKINSLSGYSASIVNLQSTGSNLYSMLTGFSGNLDATYATDSQLYTTGSTLDNKINSLSGWSASAVNLTSTGVTLINNLFNTGSNLNTKINDLSGYVNTQDNSISTNLYNTGNTLDTKINNLSGYVNTQDTTISNNLTTTGITLNNKINSLSGSSVLLYGNQSIGGVKTFRDNVYINNLFVTGTETIVSTNNFNVQSPYIILNITGGAVDGGIFFVTGAGLTGINDSGPIIGFDHSNKFKFGISTRNSDLSTLPDIASVQQIEAYSGVANNTFSTIINLASTGSTLNNKINSLSGWSASATNLYTTGSTLDLKINSLSGWSASAVNLASTGSTLNTRINNLSGYINSSSSNILFTTGNQIKSGRLAIGNTIVDASYPYTLSLQSNNQDTFLEILNSGGSGKGAFFGMNEDRFELYNWQGGDIVFYTAENQSAGTDRLYIKNSGNIGIGTNNPTEKLQVNGNIKFGEAGAYSAILYMYDSPNDAYNTATWNDSELQFTQTTDSSNLTIGFSQQGNTLVSNGSTLKLPTGKNDFIAMDADLVSTGSNLNNRINNVSGYINSSSSNIIFTTGNQTINGLKTFASGINVTGGTINLIGRHFIGIINPIGESINLQGGSGVGNGNFGSQPKGGDITLIGGTAISGGVPGNLAGNITLIGGSGNDSLFAANGVEGYGRINLYAGGRNSSTDPRAGHIVLQGNTYINPDPIRSREFIIYKSGNDGIGNAQTNLNVSQNSINVNNTLTISGSYDIYSQIENSKKLAIAYAIAL